MNKNIYMKCIAMERLPIESTGFSQPLYASTSGTAVMDGMYTIGIINYEWSDFLFEGGLKAFEQTFVV